MTITATYVVGNDEDRATIFTDDAQVQIRKGPYGWLLFVGTHDAANPDNYINRVMDMDPCPIDDKLKYLIKKFAEYFPATEITEVQFYETDITIPVEEV